jgi:hypothetical protein
VDVSDDFSFRVPEFLGCLRVSPFVAYSSSLDVSKMSKKAEQVLQDERLSSDRSSQDGVVSEFTPAEQRAIIHKIDKRLVVLVGFMYCVSLIDRANLANAAVAGWVLQLEL